MSNGSVFEIHKDVVIIGYNIRRCNFSNMWLGVSITLISTHDFGQNEWKPSGNNLVKYRTGWLDFTSL